MMDMSRFQKKSLTVAVLVRAKRPDFRGEGYITEIFSQETCLTLTPIRYL